MPSCPGSLAAAANEAFDQGFALPIAQQGGAASLIFRDVEEHVDGNGACALWLLLGSGRPRCDQGRLDLRPRDVVVFDDRLERAFDSASLDPCLGIALDLGQAAPLHLEAEALRSRLIAVAARLRAPPAPAAPRARRF